MNGQFTNHNKLTIIITKLITTIMENVTYKTLNSANVRVDNSVDTERVYDISANANIGGMAGATVSDETNKVSSVDNGEVRRKSDSMTVATFSSYSGNSLSINHQDTEAAEQCAVTNAVNKFIADVKAKVQTVSPISL